MPLIAALRKKVPYPLQTLWVGQSKLSVDGCLCPYFSPAMNWRLVQGDPAFARWRWNGLQTPPSPATPNRISGGKWLDGWMVSALLMFSQKYCRHIELIDQLDWSPPPPTHKECSLSFYCLCQGGSAHACLLVSRTKQHLLDGFQQNLVERWGKGQVRSHKMLGWPCKAGILFLMGL